VAKRRCTFLRPPFAAPFPPHAFAAGFFGGAASAALPAAPFFASLPFFVDGPSSSVVFAALLCVFVTVLAFSPLRGRFFCCFACAAVLMAFGPQKYLQRILAQHQKQLEAAMDCCHPVDETPPAFDAIVKLASDAI